MIYVVLAEERDWERKLRRGERWRRRSGKGELIGLRKRVKMRAE